VATRRNNPAGHGAVPVFGGESVFELVISNLPVSTLVHQNGNIVYANPTLLNLVGRTWDQVRSRSVFDFLTEDSKALVAKNMARRLAGEKVADYEVVIETAGQGRKNAIVSAISIPLGDAPAFLVALPDVTERKRAEERLRASEERYRSLAESSPDFIFIVGPDLTLQYLNSAAAFPTKREPQELLGKPVASIFLPGTSELALSKLRQVFENSEEVSFDEQLSFPGRRLWVNTHLVPLKDDEGKSTAVLGITRDITERKLAEEEVRSNEERLKILFDLAPDAYYLNDPQGTLIDGNIAAERLLGYSKTEMIGKSFLKLKLLSPPFLAKAAKLLAKNVSGYSTGPDEFVFNRKDGTQVTAEIRTHPIRIEGRTVVLGIARDVTARKRAEERAKALETQLRRQEKTASICTLAGGIAHEINNPLAGILNYAHLIKDDAHAAGPTAQYAAEIIRETERASFIVRQLLAFAEPKSSVRRKNSLAEILQGVGRSAPSRLLDEQTRFEAGSPLEGTYVFCNGPQIQQVLLNLIVNADEALSSGRDSGPDGRGRIRVAARDVVRGGGRFVRISVEDNGPGIPKNVLKRLFDPFFTTKSRALHSGLGLAISQRIAEEHGGRLWVESKLGQGSRFHLELPVDPGPAPRRIPDA
jgi:PAS domain S-box-containing protein